MNTDEYLHDTHSSLLQRSGEVPSLVKTVETESREIVEGTKKPSVHFIIEKDGGVFIDIDQYLDPLLLSSYLSSIFSNGFYFVNLDYTRISDLLYDFSKLDSYKKEKKVGGESTLVKIASEIRTFDPVRGSLYRTPITSLDRKSVEYQFEPVFLEEVVDGLPKEVKTKLNVDEFIAAMWNYGILFGLKLDSITAGIESSKVIRSIISEEREPTKSIDADIEQVISFEIDRGVKNASHFRADYLEYKQGYVLTEKDKVLYRKIPGKKGEPGYSIFGELLEAKNFQDISLETFLGAEVKIEVRNGVECIVANFTGFPRIEEGYRTQGRQKTRGVVKIHVEELKVFEKGINVRTTGKVLLEEEIVANEDIILETKARKITAKKNIEANVKALQDITVEGNIVGTALSGRLTQQHQRISGPPLKGNVISEQGNISVKGYTNDAYLEAKMGTVKAHNVTNSIIIGQTVEITGTLFNTIIVADTIILNGRVIGSYLLSGREVILKESSVKGDYENSISIFSKDLTQSIELKEQEQIKTTQQIKKLELELDDSIVSKFPKLRNLDFEKRLEVYRILFLLLTEPEKLTSERYKSYVSIFTALKKTLESCLQKWDKIVSLNTKVANLQQEILIEKQLMEGYKRQLNVKIGYIYGDLNIQRVKFLENKQLFEFSLDELINLSKLRSGRDSFEKCILEAIPVDTKSNFEWASQ